MEELIKDIFYKDYFYDFILFSVFTFFGFFCAGVIKGIANDLSTSFWKGIWMCVLAPTLGFLLFPLPELLPTSEKFFAIIPILIFINVSTFKKARKRQNLKNEIILAYEEINKTRSVMHNVLDEKLTELKANKSITTWDEHVINLLERANISVINLEEDLRKIRQL